MNDRKKKTLRKMVAWCLTMVMILCTLPVWGVSAEMADLPQILLSWEADGEETRVFAAPVEGADNCFWARVPETALNSLVLWIDNPAQNYEYDPANGSMLESVTDAGDSMLLRTIAMVTMKAIARFLRFIAAS